MSPTLCLTRLSEIAPDEIIELMNHPRLKEHLPLLTTTFDEMEAEALVQAKEHFWKDHGMGPVAFVIEGRFAGWGGIQPENGEADLALVLHPGYWGWGGRITRRILHQAFEEWNLPSVTVLLPPTRTRVNGLRRLGFVQEGTVVVEGNTFHRYRLMNPELSPEP